MAVETDKRIRIMNEILNGVRLIKMYTWETPFSLLVAEARKAEVNCMKKTYHLQTININIFYSLSKVIVFLTLLFYVLLGNPLTADLAFMLLALYNNVRNPIMKMFPSAIQMLAETKISLVRLQNFLLLDEKELPQEGVTPTLFSKRSVNDGPKNCSRVQVCFENVSARWNSTGGKTDLQNIYFTAKPQDLVMILGEVGSGKGSILNVVLKELPISQGHVEVSGTIAYAAQEPWIINGSIKDNILFGQLYDPSWYQQVITACALTTDLEYLPYGDNTLAGDRGIVLSGGQKARIGLARAVYSNADIVLLDDPFSAVDAKVGNILFNKCIMELLSEKLVILVTHQIQFASHASLILVLKNGVCNFQGTYDELIRQGLDFHQLQQSAKCSKEYDQENKLTDSAKTLTDISMKKESRVSNLSVKRSEGSTNLAFDSTPEEQGFCSSGTFLKSGGVSTQNLMASIESMEKLDAGIRLKHLSTDLSGKVADLGSKIKGKDPTKQDETQALGKVSFRTYYRYLTAGSNLVTLFVSLLFFLVSQILFFGSDYWLSLWTNTQEIHQKHQISGISSFKITDGVLVYLNMDQSIQLWIYCGIIGALLLTSVIRTVLFFRSSLNSSMVLHDSMYKGIIRAPVSFFETNPAGRVLNRFSKDIGQVDNELPISISDAIDAILTTLGTFIMLSALNPLILVPIGVLGFVFHFLKQVYTRNNRSLKRLEGIARSPVLSHLASSIHGITTIRAFSNEKVFVRQFEEHQDLHNSAWFYGMSTNRWFTAYLDFISICFTTLVTFSFLVVEKSGSSAGLAISSCFGLTSLLMLMARQSAEMENQMVSVERILEYSELKPEASLESSSVKTPPPNWPSTGKIRVENLSLFYRDDAPVLKNLNFVIQSSEKVGIVGRTGAGKSSLIASLFRLVEPSGKVFIDDVHVNEAGFGLRDLRSHISIVPQDPILFSGSVRYNLDPFQEFPDDQIWAALSKVALQGVFLALDSLITDGGANLSYGQRQLVCLARALLRPNRILVMDEATANVDFETDMLIQKTLADHFKHHTILNVAHRLQTVVDYDRIMMLESGRIIEFDEPYKLLQNNQGFFHSLAMEMGDENFRILLDKARSRHLKRQRD